MKTILFHANKSINYVCDWKSRKIQTIPLKDFKQYYSVFFFFVHTRIYRTTAEIFLSTKICFWTLMSFNVFDKYTFNVRTPISSSTIIIFYFAPDMDTYRVQTLLILVMVNLLIQLFISFTVNADFHWWNPIASSI